MPFQPEFKGAAPFHALCTVTVAPRALRYPTPSSCEGLGVESSYKSLLEKQLGMIYHLSEGAHLGCESTIPLKSTARCLDGSTWLLPRTEQSALFPEDDLGYVLKVSLFRIILI